jgi:hypothetical protein
MRLLLVCALALAAGVLPAQEREIQRIFDADQKDRDFGLNQLPSPEQIEKMNANDAARRKRVRELLDQGALTTGQDFRQAAFVFQHGWTPEDYLLAHLLAMVGVSKGDKDSRWIAAATLDRWLRSIEKPQVFGTQFSANGAEQHWSQEPFDRALMPDALRKEFCVPSLSQQAEMLATLNKTGRLEPPAVCQ